MVGLIKARDKEWASKAGVTILGGSSALLTDGYECQHGYTIELMSFDPLVIYVNNFVTNAEINHLLEITKEKWNHSLVYHRRGDKFLSEVDREYRTSQSAMIPIDDPVSKCLSTRLKSFLGNLQHVDTEPLQLVKYSGGERFRMHQDWLVAPKTNSFNSDNPVRPFNRLFSSFVYLEDNCTGGETYFPDLKGVGPSADGHKFSRTENGQGLLFKPRKGNAVLWNNLFMNGTGDPRMAHASLPVKSGTKIGMNMFGLYYLDLPILGEVEYDS
ncbi:hypothetical protein CNMCM7691_004305 [Aspergillus felis]|uniref:Prolyl 4-hydroxylase alpha subunit domain-containing protein n=1 Tax=Aspergillus felis TaxID=1287682 RepID=A0A8H6V9E1_9EURO|nr:hypothetical protein CNMCM7691_004305 [Aspergillus felis]